MVAVLVAVDGCEAVSAQLDAQWCYAAQALLLRAMQSLMGDLWYFAVERREDVVVARFSPSVEVDVGGRKERGGMENRK